MKTASAKCHRTANTTNEVTDTKKRRANATTAKSQPKKYRLSGKSITQGAAYVIFTSYIHDTFGGMYSRFDSARRTFRLGVGRLLLFRCAPFLRFYAPLQAEPRHKSNQIEQRRAIPHHYGGHFRRSRRSRHARYAYHANKLYAIEKIEPR